MMRCLLHQLRRPTVILAGVYLAGAGVLAGTLSPRPLAEFRARLTDDQHYELVGLTPDGRMVATTQGGTGLDGRNVPPSEPDTIWVWSLADATSRGIATGIADRPPLPTFLFGFIESHPNWQRAFWDLL